MYKDNNEWVEWYDPFSLERVKRYKCPFCGHIERKIYVRGLTNSGNGYTDYKLYMKYCPNCGQYMIKKED